MLYPFVMEPVFKKYLWGGRNLERYGKYLPDGNVAEAWEASAHPDGLSRVANGVFGGKTLKDVIERNPEEILGEKISSRHGKQLPLLFKLIDANDRLSVQVHPDDAYARAREGQPYGKHEAWYILEAAPDAKIVYGLTPCTQREGLIKALQEGCLEDCLRTVRVQAGDLIEVKPGLVHAIGNGIVLAELQQNCNLTYRLYDYGRLDALGRTRELHTEKALDVIDFDAGCEAGIFSTYAVGRHKKSLMLRNEYFALETVDIQNQWKEETLGGFRLLFVCDGEASIIYEGGVLRAGRGKTVFIPAGMKHYAVSGVCRILRMYAI